MLKAYREGVAVSIHKPTFSKCMYFRGYTAKLEVGKLYNEISVIVQKGEWREKTETEGVDRKLGEGGELGGGGGRLKFQKKIF